MVTLGCNYICCIMLHNAIHIPMVVWIRSRMDLGILINWESNGRVKPIKLANYWWGYWRLSLNIHTKWRVLYERNRSKEVISMALYWRRESTDGFYTYILYDYTYSSGYLLICGGNESMSKYIGPLVYGISTGIVLFALSFLIKCPY